MSIDVIVEEIIQDGQLTPRREAALSRALRAAADDSTLAREALSRLQNEMLEGRVLVAGRKRCANVMEELVWGTALEEFAALGSFDNENTPDLGDVAAHALNRLKPLYATTLEGAEHQRARARKDMGDEIRARVREAMQQSLQQPSDHADRAPLGGWFGRDLALSFMSRWLTSPTGME